MGGFNSGGSVGTNVGVGLSGSFGESGGETHAVFEPTGQDLNKILLAQLQGLLMSTLPELVAPKKPTAPAALPKNATAEQKAAYTAAKKKYDAELKTFNTQQTAFTKERDARAKYSNSPLQRGGLVPFMKDMSALSTPGKEELSFLERIKGLADGPRMGAEEQKGYDAILASMDPTASVAAAKQTLADIVAPSLRNTLYASGMGRSGAEGEALTRAGTEMTLPIMESVRSAQLAGGGKLLDYGQAVEQRQSGRLLSALEAAKIPREAQLQERMRPAQLLLGMLGRLPAGVAAGTSGTSFSNQIATGLNLSSGSQKSSQTGVQLGKG